MSLIVEGYHNYGMGDLPQWILGSARARVNRRYFLKSWEIGMWKVLISSKKSVVYAASWRSIQYSSV